MSEMEARMMWNKALVYMREELSHPAFKQWFEGTQALKMEEGRLFVLVQDRLRRDWLESRYAEQVEQALLAVAGRMVQVVFVDAKAKTDAEMMKLAVGEHIISQMKEEDCMDDYATEAYFLIKRQPPPIQKQLLAKIENELKELFSRPG
ncbi:DnaA N-terminal domain-containing protein [Salinithrix halophila]|uniref:DnaA N-terminal domain-containing protein n=1 Tax=Salinithrix halophila TaxID=1485204 RepID=A0ABV8JFN5_9BACL